MGGSLISSISAYLVASLKASLQPKCKCCRIKRHVRDISVNQICLFVVISRVDKISGEEIFSSNPCFRLMSESNRTVFHLILYISSPTFLVTFSSDWLTKTFSKLFSVSKKGFRSHLKIFCTNARRRKYGSFDQYAIRISNEREWSYMALTYLYNFWFWPIFF